MKKRLAITLGIILALSISGFILITRPPVLIVTDLSFLSIYGTDRARTQLLRSSLSLFRLVKVVPIANDAGNDILLFAINAAATFSSRPYCVLFPMRFISGARLYHEQFPEIPAILLEGRNVLDTRSQAMEGFYRYRTDLETDFYLAGLYSVILDKEKNGRITVYVNRNIRNPAMDAFRRSLQETGTSAHFASAYVQEPGISDVSCVVLAGSGAEFLEKNNEIPVIFFTWLDPKETTAATVVVFDDSPLVQVIPAVKMAAAGITDGQIASKITILSTRITDSGILQRLKKAGAAGLE